MYSLHSNLLRPRKGKVANCWTIPDGIQGLTRVTIGITLHPMATPVPRSKRPATSADVARLAGTSRATVSYVLNGKQGARFSEETREAVLRAAQELSYQPNVAGRSLVSGAGPVVVVMSDRPQNETSTRLTGVLANTLARDGLLTTFLQVSGELQETVDMIVAQRPRAALLAFPAGSELGRRLTDAGVTVAGFGGDSSLSVGGSQVEHLARHGHTRLAFADVEDSHELGVLPRRREVIAACEAAGLPTPPAAEVARNGEGAAEIIARWHREGVTAVCAYNDEVALAVLYGIREAGLSCPTDIAVIGCDDIPAAAVAYPPLTTVSFTVDDDMSWMVGLVMHQLGLSREQPAAPAPSEFLPTLSITRRASA